MILSRVFKLAMVLFLGTACGKMEALTGNRLRPAEKQTSRLDFEYKSNFRMLEMRRIQRLRDCFINGFTLETSYPQILGKPFQVEGSFFSPRKTRGPVPVVILFPPIGGKSPLDQEMAESLCSEKIAVFIPTTDLTGVNASVVPPVGDHNHALYRVVSTTKALIAHSLKDEKLNGEKVGLFGASLGGILSSFALSVVPEISAGYFIVAGGDLPSILAHSVQPKVVRVKRQRYRDYNFTSDFEYESWLRKQLLYDPLDFAREVPSSILRMEISLDDYIVPTENQWRLHRAFGGPDMLTSQSSHSWTIFKALFNEEDRVAIADFFNERFLEDNPRLAPGSASFFRLFPEGP